jgi:uncharacterized membrane protein
MSSVPDDMPTRVPKRRHHPFRRAVLRGLAILMPPLLTIVLFIWAWTIIENNVLTHVEWAAAQALVLYHHDDLKTAPPNLKESQFARDDHGRVVAFTYQNRTYTRNKNGEWVGYYSTDYVRSRYLPRTSTLPAFLAVFLLILYLLGKFVAAGVGRMIVNSFEMLIGRLPLVSNVYASVKQVTDFVLTEQEIEFNRVVAVQYPRKGIWSIGFVTGESLLDIRSAANEPILSVMMPTSPMPFTGFTITVKKSDVIDLDLTIDQAIQFVVSCGVVVPPQQQNRAPSDIAVRISSAMAQHGGNNGANRDEKPALPPKDSQESLPR